MENRRRFLQVLGASALEGLVACGEPTGAEEASVPVHQGERMCRLDESPLVG